MNASTYAKGKMERQAPPLVSRLTYDMAWHLGVCHQIRS
jgi:hypothetical protein